MGTITCSNCRALYPETGFPYRCSICGGYYDFGSISYTEQSVEAVSEIDHSIWRYRKTFDLPGDTPPITLGEGGTPLIPAVAFGREIFFKIEGQNPTGSYKDRGSAILVAYLKSRQIEEVVEDSSGNAGASLAAYTARGGIKVSLFVPSSASGPKLRQMAAYGAEINQIEGPRSQAAIAIQNQFAEGKVYASHAYNREFNRELADKFCIVRIGFRPPHGSFDSCLAK